MSTTDGRMFSGGLVLLMVLYDFCAVVGDLRICLFSFLEPITMGVQRACRIRNAFCKDSTISIFENLDHACSGPCRDQIRYRISAISRFHCILLHQSQVFHTAVSDWEGIHTIPLEEASCCFSYCTEGLDILPRDNGHNTGSLKALEGSAAF